MSEHTVNIRQVTRIDFWDGFRLAWGATAFVVFLIVGSQLLDDFVWQPAYDDSDAPPLRSGLRIKTDHLTGCQYFVTALGSITPRMEGDGKQVCTSPHHQEQSK